MQSRAGNRREIRGQSDKITQSKNDPGWKNQGIYQKHKKVQTIRVA